MEQKKNQKSNSCPFTDNCLISLSRPVPRQENSNFGSRICPQQCWKFCFSPDAQNEARPWSRAAFQDAEQISSPEERAARSAGYRHLSVDGPALAGCLSKCHNIECRNVFTLTECLVITGCAAHVGFVKVWIFLLCPFLYFSHHLDRKVLHVPTWRSHIAVVTESVKGFFFLHGLLLPHLYSLLRYKKPCCPRPLIFHYSNIYHRVMLLKLAWRMAHKSLQRQC